MFLRCCRPSAWAERPFSNPGAIDASTIRAGGGGADIGPLMADGVPGMALRTTGEHYFDWHHTNADTIDKVDIQDFRKAVSLFAVMGFVLADMPETLRGE